jgi:hypothetical protein
MLNKSGITKTTLTVPKQILANVELQSSVGCVVAQAAGEVVGGMRIVKAGTPVYGDLDARTTPFVAETTADTGTKGIYTVQITTPATAGDKLVIEGVNYEHAAAEDVAAKKFAGANAAAQVTSLLKMVTTADFVVEAVSGATDKIKFTQKVAKTGDAPVVTATLAEDTGALVVGNVTEVTSADTGVQTSNANAVILHDVNVTAGNANATVLIFGFVNTNMLDASVKAKITPAVKAALNAKVTFIKA